MAFVAGDDIYFIAFNLAFQDQRMLMIGDALAEPLQRDDVPTPLAPWVDWVLRGHEESRCPALTGNAKVRICAGPSRLTLELGQREGRFTQRWFLNHEQTVALPGKCDPSSPA